MRDIICDVAIVGAGPAGIAAASALNADGIENVIVFERESEAGGIPRHIHHLTFGLLVFHRPMSGPKFIAKILTKCTHVQFEYKTSVMAINPGGLLEIATSLGMGTVHAKHIILATGTRENPRHPRLVSGLRPQGIMTTGALQKIVYGEGLSPFKRPVIVGTELASFSALPTLKSCGAQAVAMIEENARIAAYRPAIGFAALMGTPIYYQSRIVDIGGLNQVEHVCIENKKGVRKIECDGVIFSGDFAGETALTKRSHIAHHPVSKLPLVDQNWVSSDRQISVIGNCIHPADMGDQCYLEGLDAGRHVAKLLADTSAIEQSKFTPISHGPRVKMTTPSAIRFGKDCNAELDVHLHVQSTFWGQVQVHNGNKSIYSKTHRCLPARRITLKNIQFNIENQGKTEPQNTPRLALILGSTKQQSEEIKIQQA